MFTLLQESDTYNISFNSTTVSVGPGSFEGNGTFGSPTTNGSVLLCVLLADLENRPTAIGYTGISAPVTAGVTWELAVQGFITPWFDASTNGYRASAIAIYYALNAPSISGSTPTSATAPCASADSGLESTLAMMLQEVGTTIPASLAFILGPQ